VVGHYVVVYEYQIARQRIEEDPAELQDLVSLIVERLLGEVSSGTIDMVYGTITASLGKDYAWPGNVRELEQAARRILLTQSYQGDYGSIRPDLRSRLQEGITNGMLSADALLSGYCALLYQRLAYVQKNSGFDKLGKNK
jgi:DNA-binding NtrC family response regulator